MTNLNLVKNRFKEAEIINFSQDNVFYEARQAIIEKLKNKYGWINWHKLDTDAGKALALKAIEETLTDVEKNPLYSEVKGLSKHATKEIGLRSIGVSLSDFKDLIDRRGKDSLNLIPNLKDSQLPSMYKEKMLNSSFTSLKDNQETIDAVLNEIKPLNSTIIHKPTHLRELYPYMEAYFGSNGRLSERDMKDYIQC